MRIGRKLYTKYPHIPLEFNTMVNYLFLRRQEVEIQYGREVGGPGISLSLKHSSVEARGLRIPRARAAE